MVPKESLIFPQGSQASFQVARATGITLELLQRLGSSLVQAGISLLLSAATEISGFLSSFTRGCQASSLVQAWNSTFLSSC